MTKKKEVLVQTRLSTYLHARLAKRARAEGVSQAALIRQLLMNNVDERSIEQRLRAVEVALLKWGIVPEGVQQPIDESGAPGDA